MTAVAVGRQPHESDLVKHLVQSVISDLHQRPAHWCVLLASAHFEDELPAIAAEVYELLGPRAMIGTTAEWTIAGNVEYERQPAIVLFAGYMPEVRIGSFHISQEDLLRLSSRRSWYEQLDLPSTARPNFVLLGDPFTANMQLLLHRLDNAWPRRPAIGGLASAGEAPGQNIMIFDGHCLRHGICGIWLEGDVMMDTVVSQGCRPIGRYFVITEAQKNVIVELGGKPPLSVVLETLQQCSPRELELIQAGDLLIGRVIDENRPSFARGDFLIRHPIGFEKESGAMMINDIVRTGQTVQFQVRDSAAADDDLATLLAARQRRDVAGVLLFACNSRGTRLFNTPSHDARAVAEVTGGAPLAGMFSAGEVGPIARRNYLHGHTASIAFFRPLHED